MKGGKKVRILRLLELEFRDVLRMISDVIPADHSTVIVCPCETCSIAAGPRHTGAVCADGKALMWGASHFVRLPTMPPDSHSYTPREVPMDSSQEALQVL